MLGNPNDPDASFGPEDLAEMFDSCRGSKETRARNDRDRAYDGQAHTDAGIRGKTLVTGLTMRDIADCITQGMLRSADPDDPKQLHLARSVVETHKAFIGTEYASRGDWNQNMLYELDWDQISPVAVIQNTMCFIEHYMGIFPNVPGGQ